MSSGFNFYPQPAESPPPCTRAKTRVDAVVREAADFSDIRFMAFESDARMIVFAVPSSTVELSLLAFAFAFARAAAESAINAERMEQPASVAMPCSIDRRPTALPRGWELVSA